MYHYVGAHWMCKLLVSLTLISASPSGGHVAAYVGVQNPDATRWVQAGVAVNDNPLGRPFLYVEWTWGGRRHLVVLPWGFGERVRGHLQRHRDFWRAGIGGMWTPWIRFRRPQRCTVLELFAGAHGSARIDGRLIVG